MSITIPITSSTVEPDNVPNGVTRLANGVYNLFGTVNLNTDGIPEARQSRTSQAVYYFDYPDTPTGLELSSTGCTVGHIQWDGEATTSRINIVVKDLALEGLIDLDVTTTTTSYKMQLKLIGT